MPSIHDSPHPVPAPPSHPVASTAAIKPLAAANQTLTSKQIPRVCPTLKLPSIGSPSPCAPSASGTPPATITRRNSRSRKEKTPLRAHCGREPRTKSECASETATLDRFPRGFLASGKLAWTKAGCASRNASRRAPMRPRCEGGSSSRAHYSQGRNRKKKRSSLRDSGRRRKGFPAPRPPQSSFVWIPRHPRSWRPRLDSIPRRLPPIRSCPLGLPPAGANPSC